MMSGFGRSGQRVCPLSRVWRVWLGLVSLATLFMTDCSRPQGAEPVIMIEHEISPVPAHAGPATITLRLKDGAAKAVTGARITVEGDMTHAGMTPVFGEAREIEPGHYQSPLVFQMAGDWVVLVHVTLANGQKLERRFDVRGVRPT